MTWYDDVHDTKADLEDGEPEEVAQKLTELLSNANQTNYRPGWKNRYMGLCMWNFVAQCPFEEYVEVAENLKGQVIEISQDLLKSYHDRGRIRDWLDDSDFKRLVMWSEGNSQGSRINKFQPAKYRTWELGPVEKYLTGLLNDAVHVLVTLENEATGESTTHEFDFELNSAEVDQLLATRFGDLHPIGLEKSDITGWELEGSGKHTTSGFCGDSNLSITMRVPFTLETKDARYELELERHIYFSGSTGEIDSEGGWTPYYPSKVF